MQGWRVWKRLQGGKGVLVNSEFIRLLAYASPDQGSKRFHFEHGRQCWIKLIVELPMLAIRFSTELWMCKLVFGRCQEEMSIS